ncbi:MAG: LPS export ABC transporter periplasmic protein LptC [Bdellovibrionales bacterium]
MRKVGSLLTAILFLGLIVEIVIFSPKDTGTPSDQPKDRSEAVNGQDGGQWIEGVHLIETSEGKKEWELRADRAMSAIGSDKKQTNWELKKVNAKFFSQTDDGMFFTVTGDEGRVVTETRDMYVHGNVFVRSSNGYEFKTQSVNYDSKTKSLKTNDPVQMFSVGDSDGGAMDLTGVGLHASLEDHTMDVLQDVKLNRELKDGRKVVVRSEKARFYSKNKSADFSGRVIVDLGASRITGPFAKFQYDSEKKALSSMEVEGGVNLTDADKWATAKKVKMSFLKDQFVLTGSPRLVQDSEELVGDEIIFSDGGKKVEVNRGRAKFDSDVKETIK